MSDELDPKDKALLKNINEFNRTYAASGWHLQDKVVSENLSGIVLHASSMNAVQFLHVDWDSAVISDTRFTGVEFQHAHFTNAALTRVVFQDCKFVICSFSKARLTNCQFINSTSEELNAREASFESCVFQRFVDNTGVFGSAFLHECRLEQCRLDNSSFYSTKFNEVVLKTCSCKNLSFGGIEGSNLSFEDTELHNCSLTGSRYGNLIFQGGRSKGLTFKDFRPKDVAIRACEKIEALSILESTWTAAIISDCKAVFELTIDDSRMQGLTISQNRISYFEMEDSTMSGNSRIADCEIAGWNLDGSTLVGVRIENCVIGRYLMLGGATFDAVVGNAITYAPGLKVSADGVKYLNGSTRFGGE